MSALSAIGFHQDWLTNGFDRFPLVSISEIKVEVVYQLYQQLRGKKQHSKALFDKLFYILKSLTQGTFDLGYNEEQKIRRKITSIQTSRKSPKKLRECFLWTKNSNLFVNFLSKLG